MSFYVDSIRVIDANGKLLGKKTVINGKVTEYVPIPTEKTSGCTCDPDPREPGCDFCMAEYNKLEEEAKR